VVEPPVVVVVMGPPGSGKSTLIASLVKRFTRQSLGRGGGGPVTVVTGKSRRVTFIECPNSLPAMLDLAKVADLALLCVDGSFGFEMETFEFLNMLQVHGFPRVMGVLTHLDSFRDGKALQNRKKLLKARFWQEIHAGAKLFYLSGLLHGSYLTREVHNLALYLWTSNTRNIDIPQAQVFIELGMISLALPKVIGVVASIVVGLLFWLLMTQTDLGKAIRAVARERRGARIVGISVDHIFAMSFGIGSACIAVAACLLIPTYYVTPKVGDGFVLIAFTTVVLGGMGSFIGALVGGLFLGVVEAWSGLWLGESLGQIGVFIIFILVLLFKPNGLFGQRNT
jgi:energy-coupling factor transporter ATP-binding protein EcfA2